MDALGRKAEADAAIEPAAKEFGDGYAYQIATILRRATIATTPSSGSTAPTCNTMPRRSACRIIHC
jgi:hypothetical protein